jgi:hypothetical protein
VPVLDGGVHARPSSRRHPVGGVAGEEDPAFPEALSDLRGRRERPDPLNPHGQLGSPGGEPDAVRRLHRRREVGRGARVDHGPEHPAVVRSGRQEDALGERVLDCVDPVAELPEERPERRAEDRADSGEHVGPALHADPERRPHRAVGAVGRDEVASLHLVLVIAVPPEDGARGVGAGLEAGERRPELDPHVLVRAQVREQDALEVILREQPAPTTA